VLRFLLQEASAPFFEILGLWIHEGHIDDPYDEFFIGEQELAGEYPILQARPTAPLA
jgi:hypothetical protein